MVIIEKFLRKDKAAVGAREQVPKPSFRGREQVPWRKQQSPAGSRSRGGNSSPWPGAGPVEETTVKGTAVPGREQIPWRKQQSPAGSRSRRGNSSPRPAGIIQIWGIPLNSICPKGRTEDDRQAFKGPEGTYFWDGGRGGRKFFRGFRNKHAGSTDLCACSTDLLPVGRRKKKRREKLPFFVENYEL